MRSYNDIEQQYYWARYTNDFNYMKPTSQVGTSGEKKYN